jgi:uncharacterized membrane protein
MPGQPTMPSTQIDKPRVVSTDPPGRRAEPEQAAVATPRGTTRFEWACLLLIVTTAAVPYLLDLGQSPFWGDELPTLEDMRMSYREMVLDRARAGHQLTYFSGLWAWRQVMGESPTVLRGLNLIYYLPAVLLCFLAARAAMTSAWALCATALFAFNPQVIYLASIIRPYTLVLLCAVAVVALSLGVGRERRWRGGAWFLAILIGLAAHFSFVSVAVAAAVATLARRPFRPGRLGVVVAATACWVPLCLWTAQHFTTRERLDWLPASLDLRTAGYNAHHLFSGHVAAQAQGVPYVGNAAWLALAIGLLAMQVFGGIVIWRRHDATPALLWLAALLMVVLTWCMTGKNVFLIERYIPGLLATQTLLTTATLAWLSRHGYRRLAIAVAVVLLLLTATGFVQNLRHDVWVQHFG